MLVSVLPLEEAGLKLLAGEPSTAEAARLSRKARYKEVHSPKDLTHVKQYLDLDHRRLSNQ